MDIVATALAFERKGASVYEDLSRRSEQPLAKELFGMLAEDERKHERYFQRLAEGQGLPTETVQASSGLEARVKEAFGRLGANTRHATGKAEGLQAALQLERDSYNFYRKNAPSAPDAKTALFYQALMAQELEHFEALDNILHYLSATGDWLMEDESQRWNWMST